MQTALPLLPPSTHRCTSATILERPTAESHSTRQATEALTLSSPFCQVLVRSCAACWTPCNGANPGDTRHPFASTPASGTTCASGHSSFITGTADSNGAHRELPHSSSPHSVSIDAALSKQVEHNQSLLANKHNTYSTLHIPTGRTAYAALAPSALVVSLSTLALSAMPVHRCTAMATQSSR